MKYPTNAPRTRAKRRYCQYGAGGILIAVVLGVAASVLLFALYVRFDVKEERAARKLAQDVEVELALVDPASGHALRFKIPEPYLTSAANRRGSAKRYIEMETGLPDMKPRPATFRIKAPKGTPEYEKLKERYNNGVFIWLHAKKLRKGYQQRMYEYLLQEYAELPSDIEGLQRFGEKCPSKEKLPKLGQETRCYTGLTEYFISTEPRMVRLRCSKAEYNKRGGCIAESDYQGRELIYIFRRTELARWQEFDDAVRGLLTRLQVFRSGIELNQGRETHGTTSKVWRE